MATRAPEVGKPMEFPSINEEEQTERVNQTNTCNLNGEPLEVLKDTPAEPQALQQDPSQGIRTEADSSMTNTSLEESPEMSEGQAAHDSQLLSNEDHLALPPENKTCKKGRGGKKIGCIRKNSAKVLASDAAMKKVTKRKAPAKRSMKIVSEPVPQTLVEHDSPAAPETPQMTLGGRPKRRAAKAALEYLHSVTKDLQNASISSAKTESDSPVQLASSSRRKTPGRKKGQKRKAPDYDSKNEDSDFDPDGVEEMESEDNDEENFLNKKTAYKDKVVGNNGLSSSAMQPLWTSFKNTKEFREEHCSTWVFSEWIPSVSNWHLLSTSEAKQYLPQEEESASFTVSREGISERSTLHKIKRFKSFSSHAERWDSLFFVGGPVWAMEWCPCPEGAAETQYAALYCNRGMDDRHKRNELYKEHALLQLWDLGKLLTTKPSSSPRLAYALAVDDGCIWSMKWCPAGAWELPTTDRKAPHMPRLGLIATGFSNGTIAVYSLPHPDALTVQNEATEGHASQDPLIYQVQRIMTVKLGSAQADHNSNSGQCFALDWLPVKPHHVLAAGFYDGIVALWDLTSKSSLLRVRSPDKSLCLYPYHCFRAHDNTIRSLAWCRATSELLVTVGDDRMVKLWNITKTYVPLKTIKRFLPTEVSWPIFWSGVFLAQESCFSTFGQQGVHYIDSGYFGHKPFFVCTRKATVWSLSVSDWLNSCVIADNAGDLICSLLSHPDGNYSNSRKHRFSLYRTEMVRLRPGQRDDPTVEEEEEEEVGNASQQEPQSYRGAIKKYYLHFHDMDLRSFKNYQEKPHTSESKGIGFLDQMPLNALYKVRFNPNMDAHCWVLSAGQSGLVRLHCVRALSSPLMKKLIHETQAQFSAMFCSEEAASAASAVRHCTADVVEVR